ncbi:MAG TPA: rod-binding protein [Magnetospirillaceae bacterium]|nr:rod-binding protein [Magnetospirillaceae bacterium]
MTIDNALLQFNSRPVRPPQAVQGSEGRPAPNRPIDRQSDLYRQCQEFESIFVNMMLKEMRKTVDKSGLLDGGMAEEIFQDMLYAEHARSMARAASFGLAEKVYIQLTGRAGIQGYAAT